MFLHVYYLVKTTIAVLCLLSLEELEKHTLTINAETHRVAEGNLIFGSL